MENTQPNILNPERRARFEQDPVDGQAFKELAQAGLAWLRTNAANVNALNVFPVPDGDTGTNMVLTMQSAVNEIAQSPEKNVGKIAHSLAHGALMGARGNSGVILSQLMRGFARALDSEPVLNNALLAAAFAEARDTAYRGVVKPVEGTILTVSKDMAAAAEAARTTAENVVRLLEEVIREGAASVERTPEFLPILKQAGVVDSGGKGLYFIVEGMLRYINGQSLDTAEISLQPLSAMNLEGAMEEVEEGQDYEVIVDFRPHEALVLRSFYEKLEEMGTSIQVGEGDGLYRVHIHVPTENRYLPIDYAMSIGTITKVHIENLMIQVGAEAAPREGKIQLTPLETGQIAVVAVSPGPGISRAFAGFEVAAIVEGGQTMNPSTQEILAAFENLPTDKVILLPNNKNIVMAAKSATELTVKQVAVIPSRTIPQGLAAMLSFDRNGDFEETVEAMEEALGSVQTGEITTATRTVEIDGVQVKDGQIIVLLNGKLVAAASDLWEGCQAFLEQAGAEDCEIVTLFYGEDLPKRVASEIADQIREAYAHLEVEIQDGGQPHYQFIISME
ncbi:MAG: DAK2 domain-containing protein [Anaerolineales bacterium]|nr:DAK2 domain-containing protein [Anaerolineales bacterium]